MWPWLCKRLYGLTSLFFFFCLKSVTYSVYSNRKQIPLVLVLQEHRAESEYTLQKTTSLRERSNIYSNSSTKAPSKCLFPGENKLEPSHSNTFPLISASLHKYAALLRRGFIMTHLRANIFRVHDNSTTMTSFHDPWWEECSGEQGNCCRCRSALGTTGSSRMPEVSAKLPKNVTN